MSSTNSIDDGRRAELEAVFEQARAIGLLGQGEVDNHIDHALKFVSAAPSAPARLLDLGSGAGVPGLVLAMAWPTTMITLLDAMERRTKFLSEATERLGLESRVEVIRGRAEELAHEPDLRAAYDAVSARSFGPPPVTLECAAGFIRLGGFLLVSEPPDEFSGDRWPIDGLASIGFSRAPTSAGSSIAVLLKTKELPGRFPRRVGVPGKRPLW